MERRFPHVSRSLRAEVALAPNPNTCGHLSPVIPRPRLTSFPVTQPGCGPSVASWLLHHPWSFHSERHSHQLPSRPLRVPLRPDLLRPLLPLSSACSPSPPPRCTRGVVPGQRDSNSQQVIEKPRGEVPQCRGVRSPPPPGRTGVTVISQPRITVSFSSSRVGIHR